MSTTGPARRGWLVCAGLLADVVRRPGTTQGLAEASGVTVKHARKLLNIMADHGLVMVVAWVPCVPANRGQRMQPVWGISGPPAPRPACVAPSTRKVHTTPKLAGFCRVIQALMLGGGTPVDLAKATGPRDDRVRPLLAYLDRRLHLAYVADWAVGGYSARPMPFYCWGPGRRSKRRPRDWVPAEGWRRRLHESQQRLFWVHMIFVTAGNPPAKRSKGAARE